MQEENRLVPKLRFSEFKGEWEKKKLGEVAVFLDGKRKPIKSSDRNKMKGKYPYYGASGIIDYVNNFIFDDELILLGEDGENIVSRNSPLAFRVSGKCWVNNHAHVIKPKKETNIDFLTTNLERVNYVIYNTGTAQPKLNKAVCESISTSFPSLPEQQKIANFLTTIDTQIQSLSTKKSLLEQYKKGVMQQLFKQELRFKPARSEAEGDDDGNAFPEWKYFKLKDIFKRSKLKNTDAKVKYVLTNSATQGIVSQNDYFDKDIANQNNLQGYYIVEKDDFIYNPRISQSAPVGPLKRNKLAQGVMSPLYTVLRPKNGNLEFLEFYFGTTLWHKYMKAIANYGARHDRMNITMTDFENLPIPFPSLKEQIKIAHFLSGIDKNIAVVSTKIEHTKAYKKGLLQQMFV